MRTPVQMRQVTGLCAAAPASFASPDIDLAARLFEELRQRTGAPEGITRMSYGPGEGIAHDIVRREAEALGLEVTCDAACNLYLTLRGREPGPITLIGSHLDSVPRGGNYDGAAGVLLGLSVAAGFRAAGLQPSHDLTVMAIRAEESTWFNASYIGSRAALGQLEPEELDSVVRSGDGRRLGDCIAAAGGDTEALRQKRAFLQPADIGVFIEPHIEQGPFLVESGAPIAVVTGIRGSFRYRQACCLGTYAHSGATPRRSRRDAVSAVAALILELNLLWRRMEQDGEDLTITVGQIATDPREHAFSKVAGRVDFALDVRSQARATLSRMRCEAQALADRMAEAYGVEFTFGAISESEPALMDGAVAAALHEAAIATGVTPPFMACGAGHDAAVFANAGVPTGMLFIRNDKGSHNADEAMSLDDFAIAAGVLSRYCQTPGDGCP